MSIVDDLLRIAEAEIASHLQGRNPSVPSAIAAQGAQKIARDWSNSAIAMKRQEEESRPPPLVPRQYDLSRFSSAQRDRFQRDIETRYANLNESAAQRRQLIRDASRRDMVSLLISNGVGEQTAAQLFDSL